MNHHIGQFSSNIDTHSDELYLVFLTQQNKRLLRGILSFEVNYYRHQDEINLLLQSMKQLKYPYFAVEQQPLISLPGKASQVSRTAFLIINWNLWNSTNKVLNFFYLWSSNKHIFLSYMTLYLTHYQIHYLNSLTEYGQKYNLWIKRLYFENPHLNFVNVSLPHLTLPLYNNETRAYTKSLDKK